MFRTRRFPHCLISAAGLALAVAGCARPAALPTVATEVILPGEDQLTPPEQVTAPAAEPETSSTQPAAAVETAAAAVPPAAAESPAAEPAPAQTTPAVTETPAAATATGGEFASFRGRVTVAGPVPSFPPLKSPGDPTVAPADQVCVANGIPDESVVLGADGGLANVFVFAKKLPAGVKAPPPPAEPAVLNQKDCRFLPQALVFRAGQPLLMTNSDSVGHNVRTTAITKSINETVAPNNTTGVAITYKKGEKQPVQTRCDIHAWMLAWHLPLDHPYAAVTDAEGRFEIPNLPPGDWEFTVWHGRAKDIQRSFKFKATAGQTLSQDFSVPAAQLSQ